jgi:sulfoquinovosidase
MTWKRLLLALMLPLAACSDDDGGGAPPPSVETRIDAAGGVTFLVNGRETFSTAGAAPQLRSFTENASFVVGQWQFERSDEVRTELSTVVDIRESAAGAEVDFASADGSAGATLAVTHPDPGRRSSLRLEVTSGSPASLALPVRCDADSGFHGFGGQYHKTDQRGESFRLFVSEQGLGRDPALPVLPLNGGPHTTYFPMPYFLDPRGFGALLRTAQRVEVDLCDSDPRVAWFEVVSGAPLEMLVFHGPTAIDVIDQLGAEVGRPLAPPDWAYDLWIGAQAGTTQTTLGAGSAAIRAEVEALRVAEIPVGVMWVQDWSGIRMNFDGGSGVQYRWEVDDVLYPDLAELIDDLHADGLRFLAYANPFIDRDRGFRFYPEMDAAGYLIRNQEGETYDFLAPNGMSSLPDFTNPGARDYVRAALRDMVLDFGMDGWMADFGEWAPTDAVYFDGSDPVVRHNLYPVDWLSISRQVMDEVRPGGDWVVFARAGFTGVHRHSMIHWIGDQETDWSETDGLPTVVPALLNLGLSGIPWVTHDIAGFSGSVAPPSTKELYQRWTELGAFTPIMRTHEGARKQLNWSWEKDAETTAHFRRFARVHAVLKSELLELGEQAARRSTPLLRHPMLEFPDDPRSRQISDQFMLGDTLLVAPVVTEGATSKTVYLPPGTWYHVWSGEAYDGGRDVTVAAPIGEPPVFSLERDRPDLRAIE